MIGLVIHPNWRLFHAASHNYNLLTSNPHPEFVKFEVTGDDLLREDVRAGINACDAIIVDYHNSKQCDFYTNGLRILTWGDEHCHTPAEVAFTEDAYNRYEYVFTGAPFSAPRASPYFYISQAHLDKRLYMPPNLPDDRPEAMDWSQRLRRALLPSNVCPIVYPFRWACGLAAERGEPIDCLRHFIKVHRKFFTHLGTYKYAITCNSTGWLNYTVAKYWEIPYMGTVLIAPRPPDFECELIGFEDGRHAIWTSDVDTAVRAMTDPTRAAEHAEMSKAGVELMMKYHTVTKRLDYLAAVVKAAGSRKLNLMDSVDIFREVKVSHGK